MKHALRFGMPSLVELEGPRQTVDLCRRLGLHFVEFNMSFPLYGRQALGNMRRLMREATDSGLFLTLHFDENAALFDFDRQIADAYWQLLKDAMALSPALGVRLINIHFERGVWVTLPEKKIYLFDSYRQAFHQRVLDLRTRAEQMAGDDGPLISIENTGGWLPFQREAIDLLLESPAFCLTWDVGHSTLAKEDDEGFQRAHVHKLRHMHLHDVKNGIDHQPLGTGQVDIADRLAGATQQNCTVVVEIKTVEALEQSVDWLKERGYL
ncbi:MAG: sugar phosphate isomerase/epimerase [Clostridiales bacterium]|nr:sugar phosphate isomerase/epimerase [Clostridiales bacterium]